MFMNLKFKLSELDLCGNVRVFVYCTAGTDIRLSHMELYVSGFDWCLYFCFSKITKEFDRCMEFSACAISHNVIWYDYYDDNLFRS